MVDKKSPVKRLSVAKSTRAPRSKKLNLDKLITSIKNISTRYKKNGKMSGGTDIIGNVNWGLAVNNATDDYNNVLSEIKKFFRTKSDILGTQTPFHKACLEIDKIKNSTDDVKTNLLESIKKFTGNNDDCLSKYIENIDKYANLSMIKEEEVKIKIFTDLTTDGYDSTKPPVFTSYPTRTSFENKTLAYLSIFYIANTLAKIYKIFVLYNSRP